MSSLALGTVQFGLDYGIKNQRGRVPPAEVTAILDVAAKGGIDTLDTAAAYGQSETVLGESLVGNGTFRVVSKLPSRPDLSVSEELDASLERLKQKRIYGYLFHSYVTYEREPRLIEELRACKEDGHVEKIGFSLYSPHEAEILFDRDVQFDIVQIPYNLFDTRFESLFQRFKEREIEVHVRSVFLQGLFFIDPGRLAEQFRPVRSRIEALTKAAGRYGISLAAICIAFVDRIPEVDRIVVGVDRLEDMVENIRSFGERSRALPALNELGDLSIDDENIILPFNWKPI